MESEPEELIGGLNLVEAARVLGIAPSTLRQRALNNQIGYQRDGRGWRFYWYHLGEYLRNREGPARSAASTHSVGRPQEKATVHERAIREGKKLGLI